MFVSIKTLLSEPLTLLTHCEVTVLSAVFQGRSSLAENGLIPKNQLLMLSTNKHLNVINLPEMKNDNFLNH